MSLACHFTTHCKQPGQLSRQSMRLLISGSWVRAPRWATKPFCVSYLAATSMSCTLMDTPAERAPWLSWLKRLSSKQEIPSSNLGGASTFFLTNPTVKRRLLENFTAQATRKMKRNKQLDKMPRPGIEPGTFRSSV